MGIMRISTCEHAAKCRAHDEAKPEGGADQPHALGAPLRRGHVRDIGLGGGDVAGHDAGERARREELDEAVGIAGPDIGERDSGEAHEKDRLAPVAIAEPAPDGREEELHEGVDRHHQRHHLGPRLEVLRVEGKQRNHDAEADQVDEDGEKDGNERAETIYHEL